MAPNRARRASLLPLGRPRGRRLARSLVAAAVLAGPSFARRPAAVEALRRQKRRLRFRRDAGICPRYEDHLLLRGGPERGAKDDRALRFDPRACGGDARPIQSLEKNRARRKGLPDPARTDRGTGPLDGRAQRQGARTASPGPDGSGGGPARGGGAARAGWGRDAAARGAPLAGSAAAGRGGAGRERRRTLARAGARLVIFLTRRGPIPAIRS